jgi:hypothetical protein
LAVLNDQGEPVQVFKQGERLHIYCEFQLKEDIDTPVINVEIRDRLNLLVHSKNSIQNHTESPSVGLRGEIVHYHQSIVLNLSADNYVINLDCFSLPQNEGKPLEKTGFQALSAGSVNRLWRLDQAFAIAILPGYGEQAESLHGGLCDLPGEGRMQIGSGSK